MYRDNPIHISMKVLILIVIFLILLMIQGCDIKEIKRDRFYNRGNRALEKQEYHEAIRFYDEALSIDPAYAKAWNNKGVALSKLNQFKDAIISLDNAIIQDPDLVSAYFNRADSYIRIGNYNMALNDLEIVELYLPDTSTVHFLKGECYYYQKKYEKGIQSFLNALKDDEYNEEILINLAIIYMDTDQLSEAEALLKEASIMNIDNPDIYNVWSMLSYKREEFDEALKYIDRALAVYPENAFYLNNKGYILLEVDRNEDALELINRSIETDPGNKLAYRNKGIYFLKTGRNENAKRLLQRAYEMDPELEDINYFLGLTVLNLSDKEKACTYFKKSMDLGELKGSEAYKKYCQ